MKIREITANPRDGMLELVHLDGYSCLETKGRYKVGDLVAYIPVGSMLPEWLLRKLNFWSDTRNCGLLAGSKGNRVKSIRIQGVVSEGICYPVMTAKGDDAKTVEIYGEPNPYFYIETDKSTVGVSGFVVYEGDDFAFAMGIEATNQV